MVQFRRLADKYPADPSIHCMVGMCYLKQGKTEQARRELQWVANYSQNPQAKQYAQSALASLNRPATGTPGSQGQGVRQDGANSPPRNLVHDSVYETVKVAAQNGWEPCPGKCLKLSTPGWGKRTVQGHPDSDNWFTFNQGQPTEYWYSQYHAGHIIVTSSDKSAVDSGACPICNGTGWVRKR